MAVYKNCWLDDHIAAEGWDSMDYGARDGSRVALRPDEARFFEYESRGPGAASTPKRRVLSTEEAERYEIVNVLAGWSL
jgi:pectinesterase